MSLSEREVVTFITSYTGLIEGTEHADYLMPLKCDVLITRTAVPQPHDCQLYKAVSVRPRACGGGGVLIHADGRPVEYWVVVAPARGPSTSKPASAMSCPSACVRAGAPFLPTKGTPSSRW